MNDNIFVIATIIEGKYYYNAGKNNVPDMIDLYARPKEIVYQWLLSDIYRDHIPEANIQIHPGLLEEFEIYKEQNGALIEELRQQEPFQW